MPALWMMKNLLQPGEYVVTPQLARVHVQVQGRARQVAMFHQVTDGSPGGKMDCERSATTEVVQLLGKPDHCRA